MKKPETSNLLVNFRFAIILFLSVCTLVADLRLKVLSDFRYYLESALYPVMVFANSPRRVGEVVSSEFRSRSDLIAENERLSRENYLQRADLLRLRSLEQENDAMRRLLNSPMQETSRRMFAEVVDVDTNPYLQRVVVNRGRNSGVYEGMPVITDEGLVGQVIEANHNFSRVLLLIDPSSSIPVVDARNQIRAIVTGNGSHDELELSNVPRSTDIREGDLLVTSGLGEVYPEGYPVAIVTAVGFSETQPFADVKARPLVDFDRMRYVLMFWYEKSDLQGGYYAEPKERTDGKVVLREARIRKLIDSMSGSRNRAQNASAQDSTAGEQQADAEGGAN